MTFEEVKRIRENPTAEDVDNAELHKMIDLAVEKQIPKKPTHEATKIECCTCPDCKNVIDEFETFWGQKIRVCVQFCKYCGQAIDWGDCE